jgi:group I intron endonuclease
MLTITDTALKKCGGIYTITHIETGMKYIGSTCMFGERLNEHRRCLRQNKHHSSRLQNYWNKYGEDGFIFEVLEVIEGRDRLLEEEEKWIRMEKSFDRKYGFNMVATTNVYQRLSEFAKSNARSYYIICPCGNEYITNNINDFCMERHLDTRSMRKVARKALRHYKFWRSWHLGEQPETIFDKLTFKTDTIQQNKNKCSEQAHALIEKNCRQWKFVSPNGETVVVERISTFCRDNGLDITTMYEVGNGKRLDHRGWKRA